MATADKLNYLKETKNQIKQAIINKGVTISDRDSFRSYAGKIGEISGGGGGGITIPEGTTDFTDLCSSNNPITTSTEALNIIAEFTKTHSIIRMSSMFAMSDNLIRIPAMDTHSVTDMGSMFSYCSNLTGVPAMDTHSVTNMNAMFSHCDSLTNVPNMNTSGVTEMSGMFLSCSNLTSIPTMDTHNATSMGSMFDGCSNLVRISLINTSSINSKWGVDGMFSSSYGRGSLPNLKHLTFDSNQVSYACDNLVFDLAYTGIDDDVSATETFNSLPNLTTMTANNHHTINLPASNTISDSVKQIAIDKGWVITQ